MDGVSHILSAVSAPWCGWTMLVLLLCAVLAEWFQPGVITQSPSGLQTRTERMYKEAPTNFMGQLLIALFRIGTPAMALCLCFCSPDHASFAAFGAIVGLIVAVMLVKMVCSLLLNYTFSLSSHFGNPFEAYGNIATLGAVILYPMVLVLMHVPNPVILHWLVGIMAVLYLLAWAYRAVRTYMVSLVSVLYLVFYIATLEVLPMALLIYLSAKTITIL